MKKLLLAFIFTSGMYAQSTTTDLITCDFNNDAFASFDLTTTAAELLNNLPANEYTVAYFETPDDAEENTNAIAAPENYMNINSNSQTIYTRVTEIEDAGNYYTGQFDIIVNPTPETAQISLSIIDNDDEDSTDGLVNVSLETVLSTLVAFNNDTSFEIDFFTDQGLTMPAVFPYAVTTSTTLYYRIQNSTTGCMGVNLIEIMILPGNFETPAPTGQAEQTFTEGETLADLEVEGENIQWYDNDGTMPDFPDGNGSPLPLTTLLVDGTTYYASQTIDGVESAQRLAVNVSFILNIDNGIFNRLEYYPNPVNNILNLQNTNGIDSISVANTLGQTMFTKVINSSTTQVDVSSLSKDIYFVTITSGSASTTIKVIKQ